MPLFIEIYFTEQAFHRKYTEHHNKFLNLKYDQSINVGIMYEKDK